MPADLPASTHPAIAEVLAIYRVAIHDDDVPADLAARYVAATLRWAAQFTNCLDDSELLRATADDIDRDLLVRHFPKEIHR